MPAVVDDGKCVGCGNCLGICPVGAISLGNGKAWVAGICIECGACTKVCPQHAISLSK